MSEKDTLRGKSSSLCEANPQAARIPEVEASALVEELRDRVRSLEHRPDEARESRSRADTNIAQLTQANTALAARVPEAPRDPQRGGHGAYHPVSLSRCAL
jgi:chromosome segregation ATPase